MRRKQSTCFITTTMTWGEQHEHEAENQWEEMDESYPTEESYEAYPTEAEDPEYERQDSDEDPDHMPDEDDQDDYEWHQEDDRLPLIRNQNFKMICSYQNYE